MTKRPAITAALLAALAGSAQARPPSTTPFPAQFNLSTLLPANGGAGADGFVINGVDAFDRCGRSVSSAGDVNGDGIDDLIIGAYSAESNGQFEAGKSYVVFGATDVGAGGSLDLALLNGTSGFVMSGINASDQCGRSVSAAGDVNGDGFDDLIVGAWRAAPNGQSRAGETYVIYGAANVGAGGVLDLSSLNGANGFVMSGVDANDYSGCSVSSAGDVNGDGFDDLIIGASGASPIGQNYAGKSFVVFGAATLGAGGSLNLSALSGADGFVINGVDAYDASGVSVASAGDVNGDGVDDLIIGAFLATPIGQNPSGESYVIFGATDVGAGGALNLSALSGANGFVINGIDTSDYCGYSVSSAGDVNGDGFDDLLVGAFGADLNGKFQAGESYVIFGDATVGAGGSINLSSLNGADGFVLNGIDAGDWCGRAVSSAGDVNSDGFDDLLIGAPGSAPNGQHGAGETYLVFGAANVGAGGSVELASLDGATGFVVNGIDPSQYSGSSVSSAGDVNGDGVDDLVIGAPFGSGPGESYVIFGRNLVPPAFCPGNANGDNIVDFNDINAVIANWLSNYAPGTGPGDANNDGTVDFNDINAVIANWLAPCP